MADIIDLKYSLEKLVYQNFIKRILFLIDPEKTHNFAVWFGSFIGQVKIGQKLTRSLFDYKDKILEQEIRGIKFGNPIGLSAGFDYEAKLTEIVPYLGFGFASVGTITNLSYAGNPGPMLGRLPKSRSLMVNKGFKNLGANFISKKLSKLKFDVPIGISIGRSNSKKLRTQKESVLDIVESFKIFEKSNVKNSYYELNISCPNIIHGGDINFYSPKNLRELLSEIEKLKIEKPIFVKMPIEKSNKEIIGILKVISKFSIKGVIIGNLRSNRKDKSLDQEEVSKFERGNFSGKPCEERSNELIEMTYGKFGKKLVIIGVGGVFSAEDAYKKIKLGASLIQLITGMVYNGPSLIGEINFGIAKMMRQEGYNSIQEVVGKEAKI